MRMQTSHQAWMRANLHSLCTLANVKGEDGLYGRGGIEACFFDKEVVEGVLPRVVALNLLDNLLYKYTKLHLKRTGTVKNMKLCDLPAIVLPKREHIRLKPHEWQEQVVVPLALEAHLGRCLQTNVSTLVLGPEDLVDRMVEFIHDRAANKNVPQVSEPLAQRAQERKARFEGAGDVMVSSIADVKDLKRVSWVSGMKGKAVEKWSKALA